MKSNKIQIAIISLHISTALYVILLLAVPVFLAYFKDESFQGPVAFAFGGLWVFLCLVMAVFIEVVVRGIRQRKRWAWIAGLCLAGLYLPSLFMPLGALGLWGLLDKGSRAEFGFDVS
jgi:drug/metabolite transporter superfamily protein YnfA